MLHYVRQIIFHHSHSNSETNTMVNYLSKHDARLQTPHWKTVYLSNTTQVPGKLQLVNSLVYRLPIRATLWNRALTSTSANSNTINDITYNAKKKMDIKNLQFCTKKSHDILIKALVNVLITIFPIIYATPVTMHKRLRYHAHIQTLYTTHIRLGSS